MEIFKWVKELEKVYEDLIEEAQKESLNEIQTLRDEQEKILNESLQKKQDFINLAIKSLLEEVNKEIGGFKKNLENKLKEIEIHYEKTKENTINILTNKLGLDFNV